MSRRLAGAVMVAALAAGCSRPAPADPWIVERPKDAVKGRTWNTLGEDDLRQVDPLRRGEALKALEDSAAIGLYGPQLRAISGQRGSCDGSLNGYLLRAVVGPPGTGRVEVLSDGADVAVVFRGAERPTRLQHAAVIACLPDLPKRAFVEVASGK